ncbi:MAG: hypothetical protein GDA43_12115 [Hormoscilla sp. SP5CHS1]|nr:hypothetical protein [Hormoscilla sp. SP12CHS1]MBC6453854.1 hypothetical protein [Hormoscilla sp. SP5CHS1]
MMQGFQPTGHFSPSRLASLSRFTLVAFIPAYFLPWDHKQARSDSSSRRPYHSSDQRSRTRPSDQWPLTDRRDARPTPHPDRRDARPTLHHRRDKSYADHFPHF